MKRNATFSKDVIQTQQKAYQECLRRIDNLVKLKTSPQNSDSALLSDEEYGHQRMQLMKEKAALEELLQDGGHGVEKGLDISTKAFDFAWSARDRFAKGDCATRKRFSPL